MSFVFSYGREHQSLTVSLLQLDILYAWDHVHSSLRVSASHRLSGSTGFQCITFVCLCFFFYQVWLMERVSYLPVCQCHVVGDTDLMYVFCLECCGSRE